MNEVEITKLQDLAYGITQIKTKSLTVNEPDTFSKENIDVIGEFGFQTVGIEDNAVELSFDIVSSFVIRDTQEILVKHAAITKYKIINIKNILDQDSNALNLPDQLMVTLYGMAHTHARALLAAELKTTIFKDKLFIPIIDPSAILKYKPNS